MSAEAGLPLWAQALSMITGSVPDVISAVDVVAGWVSAQEGLKYKLHVFPLSSRAEKTDNASLRTSEETGKRTQKPASMAKVPGPVRGRTIMSRRQGTILTIEAKPVDLSLLTKGDPAMGPIWTALAQHITESKAVFKVQWITSGTKELGLVYLSEVKGFNFQILSQMEVEFGGAETDAGYLLTFSGFVNRFGLGFGHFSGSTVVMLDEGIHLAPVFGNITPTAAGKKSVAASDWYFEFV